MRRAGLLAVLVALAAASPAAADRLVFDCGRGFEDICGVRPDGTGLHPLTSGGDPTRATDGYFRAPAITRDGTTFAYVYESDVYVRSLRGAPTLRGTVPFSPLLIRFRPDGARFAVAELSAVIGGTQVCTYNSDLSGSNEGRYCLATGVSSGMDYLPDGRLLMSRSGGTATAGRTVISLLRPEDGGPTGVERTLVDDPAFDLESPAVSPDGRLVAVVQAAIGSGTTGDIALYDLATGALVRTLTGGAGASSPTFSPDGRRVAFDRGDAIWVTSATGGPGRERRVVRRGRTPSWGGGTIPPAFTRLRVARRQTGGLVRGRMRIARAGSRVVISLSRGGRQVRRSVRRGVLRFSVRARRRGAMKLRITVTPPGLGPDVATRTVRVSR